MLPTHYIVLSLITSLRTNSQLDPIPLNLLRSLSPYVIGLVTELINICIISSIVPHSMKYSYMKCMNYSSFFLIILDQSNLSSYRPIFN